VQLGTECGRACSFADWHGVAFRRFAPIFVVSLVLLGLSASATQACAPARGFFGMDAQDVWEGNDAFQDLNLNRQRDAGVETERLVFDWMGIEREPGQYSFERYDRYIAKLANRGIRVMPMLFNPPQWRSGRPPGDNSRGVYPPAHYTDMGDFGAVIARRYGAGGSFWSEHPELPKLPVRYYQIWTEPNIPTSWPPRANAAEYAGLLKATSPRIKAADPTAQIVTAGLPESGLDGTIPMRQYIAQLYQAGGAEGFDVLALNPYSETAAGAVSLVEQARAIMRQFGDSQAGTMITEVGWASSGTPYRFTTDEAGQANRLTMLMSALAVRRQALDLRGVIWFTWHDLQTPPDAWPYYTGLLRRDNSPKPAYYAYRRAAARLERCSSSSGVGASQLSPDNLLGISAPELLRSTRRRRDQELRTQANVGVRWLRQVFDARRPRLSRYDPLVLAAAKAGIRVVPVLYDSSGRRGGRAARLASLAGLLARRYGPDGRLWRQRRDVPKVPIRSWQVWREPNLARAWGGRPSPRGYAALLKAVSRRVKRSDSGAEIIGALSYARGAMPAPRFVARLYGAWARRSFDALSLDSGSAGPATLLRRARAIRNVMRRAGDPNAGIWITSFGWRDGGKGRRLRSSRRRQAARIRQALLLLARERRALRLHGIGYVAWRDGAGDARGAGLLDGRGRRKPAYRSFAAAARKFR
jgi:hypothetical protein